MAGDLLLRDRERLKNYVNVTSTIQKTRDTSVIDALSVICVHICYMPISATFDLNTNSDLVFYLTSQS